MSEAVVGSEGMKRNRRELSDDFGPNLTVLHRWCMVMELTYGGFWLLASGLSQR